MTLSAWLSLVGICLLGALSPGPSLALVLRHTVRGSRRQGMIAAISHGLGVGFYAWLVVAGLGSLFREFPWLHQLLAWSGAAFLAWLGLKALLSKGQQFEAQPIPTQSTHTAWRDGFLIAFLNPKLAIFFVALFSQFITPELSWSSKLLMASTAWLIDTGWYLLVALALSHSRLLPWLRQHALWIDRGVGVALLLIALRVLTL